MCTGNHNTLSRRTVSSTACVGLWECFAWRASYWFKCWYSLVVVKYISECIHTPHSNPPSPSRDLVKRLGGGSMVSQRTTLYLCICMSLILDDVQALGSVCDGEGERPPSELKLSCGPGPLKWKKIKITLCPQQQLTSSGATTEPRWHYGDTQPQRGARCIGHNVSWVIGSFSTAR